MAETLIPKDIQNGEINNIKIEESYSKVGSFNEDDINRMLKKKKKNYHLKILKKKWNY